MREYFDIGMNGDGFEKPLESAYRALAPPLAKSVNAGFRRPDARLVLMFATDAAEQSSWTVGFYRQALESLAGRGKLVASGLVPLQPSDPGGSCAYDQRFAGARPEWREFFASVGGQPEEICTTDMAASLRALGSQAFKPALFYSLAQEPAMPLQVSMGGRAISVEITYAPACEN